MKQVMRNFLREESGSASVELLLCVPILVWVMLSTIVYFDAFHHEAISTRASLTIADMVSREDNDVDMNYVRNARDILRMLTTTEDSPDLRITVFEYRETQDDYRIVWSRNRGYGQNVTNAMLRSDDYLSRLPIMSDDEKAILVETRTEYEPLLPVSVAPFRVSGLDGVVFNTFTVISPRFAETVCFVRNDGNRLCG